jgi:hypothetical protein
LGGKNTKTLEGKTQQLSTNGKNATAFGGKTQKLYWEKKL